MTMGSNRVYDGRASWYSSFPGAGVANRRYDLQMALIAVETLDDFLE